MFPNLTINLEKIRENTKNACERCAAQGIDVTAITKCCAGNPEVARAFLAGGAKALGDSRILNLEKIREVHAEKWLIRIPMISEAYDAVLYSDVALASEVSVIEALNAQAKRNHKKYGIILMGDVGDLREGWFDEKDYLDDLKRLRHLDYLTIRGVGTNTNCASGLIPEPETFGKLTRMYEIARDCFGETCNIFSGGSSGSWYMLEDGTLPPIVNNLRLGEVLLFGTEASYGKLMPYMHPDVFHVNAEVIEIKDKPSKPVGKIGLDAFKCAQEFEDKGIRRRMILAIGKQDMDIRNLFPVDDKLQILTASSDHLLVDVTDSDREYKVGDIVSFDTDYAGALRANISPYVETITE